MNELPTVCGGMFRYDFGHDLVAPTPHKISRNGDVLQAGALGCASGLLSACGQDVLCFPYTASGEFLLSPQQSKKIQAVLRRSAYLLHRPATLNVHN
jgi:hypothetical protein